MPLSIEVRAAVFPVLDVVGLSPGGGPVAAFEAAATVSFREGDALPLGEQPLLDADVDDAVALVEQDGHDAGFADLPFHGRDADRRGLSVDRAGSGAPLEVGQRDAHDHLGPPHRKDHPGLDSRAEADELNEGVGRDLLDRPLIGAEGLGAVQLLRVDESRSAPTW